MEIVFNKLDVFGGCKLERNIEYINFMSFLSLVLKDLDVIDGVRICLIKV